MSRRQKPSGPIDRADRAVGALARRGEVAAERRHPEHAAAIGEDALAVEPCAGVEDLDLRLACRALEAADLGAAQRVVGIAPGRQDDTQGALVVPAQIDVAQVAVARGDEGRD